MSQPPSHLRLVDGSNPDQYQIVVVDSFYDHLSTPFEQELFGKIFGFRIQSYRQEYPYGVLPASVHDVVGTHFMVLLPAKEHSRPLLSFKCITYDQCKKFRLPFPATEMLRESQETQALEEVQTFIDQVVRSGKNIGYIGSWTIDANLRKIPSHAQFASEISNALFALWCENWKIQQIVTFAISRFKVERHHRSMGLVPLVTSNGTVFRPVQLSFLFDEPATISVLHENGASGSAKELAKKYADLWQNRIQIGEIPDFSKIEAA